MDVQTYALNSKIQDIVDATKSINERVKLLGNEKLPGNDFEGGKILVSSDNKVVESEIKFGTINPKDDLKYILVVDKDNTIQTTPIFTMEYFYENIYRIQKKLDELEKKINK